MISSAGDHENLKILLDSSRWVLLTACFSHEGTAHILVNMLSLYFMAPPVLGILRNAGFLTLYLFSVSLGFWLIRLRDRTDCHDRPSSRGSPLVRFPWCITSTLSQCSRSGPSGILRRAVTVLRVRLACLRTYARMNCGLT